MKLLMDLIQAGLLTRAQANWVEDQARQSQRPVEDILLLHGLASAESLRPFGVQLDRSGEDVSAALDRSARMLQTVFELCVQSGVITQEEFLERLAQTSGAVPAPMPPSADLPEP